MSDLDWSTPARSLVAVFIADLADPVDSDADATLRAALHGHPTAP